MGATEVERAPRRDGDAHARRDLGALVGVMDAVGDRLAIDDRIGIRIHGQGHVGDAVQVCVQRRAGRQVQQVLLQVAHLDADGVGGDVDLQVGVGELARVGTQARPQRRPLVLLGELKLLAGSGRPRRVDYPLAVERVLLRHGRPQPQRVLLAGQGHHPQPGGGRVADPQQTEGDIQVGGGRDQCGVQAVVVGRERRIYGDPVAPAPVHQPGGAGVLHPDQIVGLQLAAILGRQADEGIRHRGRVGVVGGRRAARLTCVEIDKQVSVVVPVCAGPGQPQRVGVPCHIQPLGVSKGLPGVGVAHQFPVGANLRAAACGPAVVGQVGDIVRGGGRHICVDRPERLPPLVAVAVPSDDVGIHGLRLADRLLVAALGRCVVG